MMDQSHVPSESMNPKIREEGWTYLLMNCFHRSLHDMSYRPAGIPMGPARQLSIRPLAGQAAKIRLLGPTQGTRLKQFQEHAC
jgi:hypothetical protein